MTDLRQLLRRLVVPGCGPVCIPFGAPSGVAANGVPSCVGQCRKCTGTAASRQRPWYWWRDGQLRPDMPPLGQGYLS